MKARLITLTVILALLFLAKYILFNYPISSGKRVGNLTRLTVRGKLLKTWEGTLNEGYGEKLTTYFSISDSKIAEQLYAHEGREVVIFYEEYLLGWPRETRYDVVRWEAQASSKDDSSSGDAVVNLLSKTLFCSFLGTLKTDEELYQKVKNHVANNNYYLYQQYELCNQKP